MTEALVEACRLLSSEALVHTRDVACAVGLSSSYFQRCFKKHLGVTPQQYRRRILAERGREALGAADSVTQSVYEAGYSSSSRFYEGLGQELGMKPSVARAGGPGEVILYALAQCSLGHLVIAWTRRGVCEVGFADSPGELVPQLKRHFPKAKLDASDPAEWVEAVIGAVEMTSSVDIPLDIRGTAFQERVWRELRAIPAGETRTYSQIASALGQPSAVRAVARACATNSLAVLVPCHRAVRKDGSLAGYRWGVERKRELLLREARKRSR
jgi:AraC family transcriptional regulator of adaptative response/methylated-DNA-[protein]-cysteine methyltransferase